MIILDISYNTLPSKHTQLNIEVESFLLIKQIHNRTPLLNYKPIRHNSITPLPPDHNRPQPIPLTYAESVYIKVQMPPTPPMQSGVETKTEQTTQMQNAVSQNNTGSPSQAFISPPPLTTSHPSERGCRQTPPRHPTRKQSPFLYPSCPTHLWVL